MSWVILAFLLLIVLIMLIGVGGAPVIWLISIIAVLAWWTLRAVVTIAVGLVCALLLPILKLMDPETWKTVRRAVRDRRR
ncbi:hypothetical protein [Phenylobacterium sp. 58.2.17]|uniref:hypothetical protein n=1 Tax=Phenylobacterium sp. 58.2.17 TaxID=2969306 RepID=UPI00226414E6|nr:hypothetical protein [Phenylobacterium sp. 58.2.17]MCX7584900.1 hypothetical protein [Phenylobacterium sp. 58.2.17]